MKAFKIISGVGGWIAFAVILYLYLNCGGVTLVIPDGPTSDTSWSVEPKTKCEKNPLLIGDGEMDGDLFTVPCGDGCKKAERKFRIKQKKIFYRHAIQLGYSPMFLFRGFGWEHTFEAMYWYQWERVAIGAGLQAAYIDIPQKQDFGIGPKIAARYSF